MISDSPPRSGTVSDTPCQRVPASGSPPVSENTVYAIIEDSGTQIMVREGDVIEVDLRQESPEAGSDLVFDRVLAVGGGDGEASIGTPYLSGASVNAEVVGETKGEKIVNVMYKRRKGMRRKSGHRQRYVTVKIGAITTG